MMPRDVPVCNSEYSTSPSFQLHPWSIASFILALNMGISSQPYGLLKTYDETLLQWESTAASSLNTVSSSLPTMYVKSITKRDNVD